MATSMGGKPGDVGSKAGTPPEKMTAYERWVLPNMEVDNGLSQVAIASPKPRREKRSRGMPEPDEPVIEETVAPLTAEDVEAIRQAAYEEGFQEGKEAGYKAGKDTGHEEGFKSGAEDVRAVTIRLSQICRNLIDAVPAQDDKLEAVLKQLVTNICTQVVRRELILDSDGVAEVVKEALNCMQPGNKRIRIHLNPNDVDIIEKELRAQNQWDNQWRLLAHKTITPGGCIIDTDDSIVDARAEKRLNALLQQIYGRDAQALHQESAPKDSLSQVLSEVQSFADTDLDTEIETLVEKSLIETTFVEKTPVKKISNEPSLKEMREATDKTRFETSAQTAAEAGDSGQTTSATGTNQQPESE